MQQTNVRWPHLQGKRNACVCLVSVCLTVRPSVPTAQHQRNSTSGGASIQHAVSVCFVLAVRARYDDTLVVRLISTESRHFTQHIHSFKTS